MKRTSFEVFKSNVCHRVKDIGELDFIIETLKNDTVTRLYDMKWFPEALYMLAMVDYLSRLNNIPLCTNYNKIRSCKLDRVIYPSGILMQYKLSNNDAILRESYETAIPEFKHFNIAENDVKNVV